MCTGNLIAVGVWSLLANPCFGRFLLIDSRPRRVLAVLPAGIPVPLLATTLDTLFNRFHAPSVSLMSSPVACAVSAGVRSALIIDIGWAETVVTAVYEYREVQSNRTIRAGKALVENTHKLVASIFEAQRDDAALVERDEYEHTQYQVSFEECEEIATRLAWCKPARSSAQQKQEGGLPTVAEQDESETGETGETAAASDSATTSIPLRSTTPPTSIAISFEQLSTLVETTFFDSERPHSSFDDEEHSVPLLIYRSLLKLPLDIRAICMARIIFTGGSSNVLGLRKRVFDEVNQLIQSRGWDPVQGKGAEAYKTNPNLKRRSRLPGKNGPTEVASGQQGGGGGGGAGGHEQDGVWVDAPSAAQQEPDPIEEQLRKRKDEKPRLQGQVRAIESLGAWTGASLLNLLKAPPLATVEREAWREQGVSGASRPGEVDQKVAQRQSMGAGGLMRSVAGANWTLGVWGYL